MRPPRSARRSFAAKGHKARHAERLPGSRRTREKRRRARARVFSRVDTSLDVQCEGEQKHVSTTRALGQSLSEGANSQSSPHRRQQNASVVTPRARPNPIELEPRVSRTDSESGGGIQDSLTGLPAWPGPPDDFTLFGTGAHGRSVATTTLAGVTKLKIKCKPLGQG